MGAEADDEPPAVNTAKNWSDAELIELGNMLIGGLSIAEIASSAPGSWRCPIQSRRGRPGLWAGFCHHHDRTGKGFRGSQSPGEWRVEKFDDDGWAEIAIFGGPNARQRAIEYPNWRYRDFEEVSLAPRPDVGADSQQ